MRVVTTHYKEFMEKRTLIALALSFMILGFYPVILQKFYPDYYKQSLPAGQAGAAQRKQPTTSADSTVSKPTALSGTFLKAGDFVPEEDIAFRNPKLELIFNKKDS